MRAVSLLAPTAFCVLFAGCQAVPASQGQRTCTITAAVTPSNAMADHSAVPPGNQVQFSLVSTVNGTCPLIADQFGSWSTSDTVNTAISTSTQNVTQAVAMCLNTTANPATITYSGTVRGHSYSPAALSCK